ncbi:hypothetical protein AVEN_241210-1 [Araneus ventricosus]|uniref:Uncharacterized protein n=1 Tax=Araneus ventricosus TaxID=182803 RepID=A0A4Y2D1M6_ARAVE|nr:hypothetical protein AVEN_241210-1 [Araneus ventricosus]
MIGEDLQKFSESRVMKTIAIGRVPIRNLPKNLKIWYRWLSRRRCRRRGAMAGSSQGSPARDKSDEDIVGVVTDGVQDDDYAERHR